ncbi:MAG: GYD domain-containing protein [Bradymonadales bacterium]|nr:GYD domain-containing protein [Bradymonadales bacterium]
MGIYVLMTKLTPEITQDLRNRQGIGKQWMSRVKKACPEVKWLSHYALLGPYDFMDIYEAPSNEVAAKVSLITLSSGALQAESWPAIEYAQFLNLVRETEGAIAD